MQAGSLAGARDPTAVLMSRIGKAQRGTLQAEQEMPGDWKCPNCGDLNFARNAVCRMCQTPNPNPGASSQGRAAVLQMQGMNNQMAGLQQQQMVGLQQQQAMQQQAGMQQLAALAQMAGMSAMGAGQWGGMGNMAGMDGLETMWNAMCQIFKGSGKGGQGFEQQQMQQQPTTFAGIVQQKRSAQSAGFEGASPVKFPKTAPQNPEEFLEVYGIEGPAADKFRELPLEQQTLVMDAGSLADARDPAAVLVGRINKAKLGTLKPAAMMPGDWKCPACGDHNFARNLTCRTCGHANENPVTDLTTAPVLQTSVASPEVEAFLYKYGIAPHAGEIFRQLKPGLQRLVMDAGSLAGAREPTAVLMSRIGKAQRGQLQPETEMPGDWKCQHCGDLNFSHNLPLVRGNKS